MIQITQGDLLKSPAEALVNCVNTVGVMGAGLAKQFKAAFPEMFQEYAARCKRREVRMGFVSPHWTNLSGRPVIVINFPTKLHWRDESYDLHILKGLESLVATLVSGGIKSVAIPALGCGLGGLDWNVVKLMIYAAFEAHPEITVYLYPPEQLPIPSI